MGKLQDTPEYEKILRPGDLYYYAETFINEEKNSEDNWMPCTKSETDESQSYNLPRAKLGVNGNYWNMKVGAVNSYV